MVHKKAFSETAVQTTHLLKKCIVQPVKDIYDQTQNTSFKRGVLQFDDFNYNMYNPYILIEKKLDIKADHVK
jgi:hypothetical protein